MEIDELFQLKAAALLHDPPNKAWLIVRKGAHEEAAKRFSEILFRGTVLQDAIDKLEADRIGDADQLAAGVDRWLLHMLGGYKPRAFRHERVNIKNSFDPSFSVELDLEEPKDVDSFFADLKSIIAKAKEPRIAWHLLYSLYEVLWIKHSFATGPADTRIPTHSIFDHCYATASVVNWLSSDKPDGMLVIIDIAGVQSFISESRKLRDLWAASYIVSSLMWSVIWPFVKKIGPDVLIKPTCRDNPFYYHSLLSMLRDSGVGNDVIKKMAALCKEFLGYNPEEDVYPNFAVIPEKATLILPSLDILSEVFGRTFNKKEDLEEFIKSYFREVWKQIYETIVENLESDESLKRLGKEMKDWRKYGFDETPPLTIRVASVNVNEVETKLKSHLYDRANWMLSEKLRSEAQLKFRPEIELKLTDLTRSSGELGWPKKSERAFEYCTMCGRLPALLVMPREEESSQTESIGKYFLPGERLCPYCLVKRFFASYADEILRILLGKISDDRFRPVFPSVSDVASIEFKQFIVQRIKEIHNKDQKSGVENIKRLRDLMGLREAGEVITPGGKDWWFAHQKLMELANEITYHDKAPLYSLIRENAELLYFSSEAERRKWNSFAKNLSETFPPQRVYYSLVKSDADNMGKLIYGEVEKAIGISIGKYLKDLLEGDSQKAVTKIIDAILKENEGDPRAEDDLREAEEILVRYIKDEAGRRIEETKNFLKEMIYSKRIIVSLSYHMMISRALMRTALRDVKIVSRHKGVVVYTGGDDLFALAPVSEVLPMIYEMRRSFSLGSDENPGFERVGRGKYYIPSLVSVGRSYSVYEAHYMYPLYLAVGKTIKNLESYAKRALWKGRTFKLKPEKDALILCYSARGGGEQTSLLPLGSRTQGSVNVGNLAKHVMILDELVRDVEENGIFTSSLIYDFDNNRELIKELLQTGNLKVLEKILTTVFKRNHVKKTCEKVDYYVSRLNTDLQISCDSKDTYFLIEFLKGLQVIRNGLRGGH